VKYVGLIYQGSTPLPGSPEWEALPAEEQQRVYAEYGELNQTPGSPPACRWACRRTRRRSGCPTAARW
jgi:hypothetical protein